MLPCPRCGVAAIEDDAIACPNCNTVVRFFCEVCNDPVMINERQCPSCGVENPNYDPAFDKDRGACGPEPAAKAMESEFDDECSDIAKEIAELKSELGKSELADAFSAARANATRHDSPGKAASGQDGGVELSGPVTAPAAPAADEAGNVIRPRSATPAGSGDEKGGAAQKVLSAWDCDVVVHSKNTKEPVHIGLGTDPWKARGIPGTAILTQSAFIFISYVPQLRNINDVFAYVSFNVGALNDYHLDPEMSRNYLVFNSTGLFKKKFPGTLAININFTWSKVAADGDVQAQIASLKRGLQEAGACKAESRLLSGDYLFTQGKKPAGHPEIRDILQELKGIPAVHEIIADRYPSLGKL
ncbi:MAG: zinc ribbon domain-containing protein [Candidatus Lokiarchaeota archaeon]|nr:zinc ribbon domain-containing protein [Candidatus Lokiarchaeota archaeon]